MTQTQQESKLIGYLGPHGTYSEEVAFYLNQHGGSHFIPYRRIDTAIRAVMAGEIDECVVPLENSLEGSVNITLDTLAHDVHVFIIREIIWPIEHNLLIKRGTAQIDTIISHPQALAQCRQFLSCHYPHADIKAIDSTAEAAKRVADGAVNHAAVGSTRAANLHGLEIKHSNIQDYTHNCTRFVVLGRQLAAADEEDSQYKTSVACQIDGQKPGSLCEILQEFAHRSVNLTRIESRPARVGLGVYIFFLDIAGGIHEQNVAEAVEAVKRKSQWFKNLGSYPVLTIR